MSEFVVQPGVYRTGDSPNLLRLLEGIWIRDHSPGDGDMYLVSGFGTYNGGVRFFEVFRRHVEAGGRVTAVLGGSTAQSLSSRQLVEGLLAANVTVHVVNRKRLLHAKCYGVSHGRGERLVVTSGNFTGPGLSLNVEASLSLDETAVGALGFQWRGLMESVLAQPWDIYQPTLADREAPAWRLLYDEVARDVEIEESDESTMLVRLGHSDTARIQAARGSRAGRGTQYFWLSRDAYGFFPPLTIRNVRGDKATFSCLVTMHYVDLGETETDCRVTFEAENNLDFRLGTGRLRHTRAAAPGDIAAISRIGESEYELRILRQGTEVHGRLAPYMVNFVGHQGKQYGFVDNARFESTPVATSTSPTCGRVKLLHPVGGGTIGS
jgi:hypothetical protein